MRKICSLNDNWEFTRDGKEIVPVSLPHTWNNVDGQDGGNDYYRGTCTYTRHFARPALENGERAFLEFKGVAMSAEVLLNGKELVRHDGGFSTFRADMTQLLENENTLTVKADNSANNRVYPQMADFTFYGGIYRDVNMIIVPEEHFELVKDGTPGIKVDAKADLETKKAVVTVETWHNAKEVMITVNGETKTVENKAEFVIENVHLWDGLDDPYMYTAQACLASGDCVCVNFGVREFEIDPQKGFFLNGRSYPLRGVARHQDRIGLGNAITLKELQEDMDVVLDIGANTLRLAHYQHAQEFYDLCDEKGIIVWAEIPYISKHMSEGKQNAQDQMRELITQCYHHPSIVCWGLSNEITAGCPLTDEIVEDHKELNDLCHRMDRTRPTVMAHAFMMEKDSPLVAVSDLASYNLYFGWYLGELEQNDQFFDEYHRMFPDRVIGFSEYGADANISYHSSKPEQGDYTEEYQCIYHEHILRCIDERPYLWATHVWNLFDFAADGRDEGGKKGQNQKGLVEFDHKTRKDAFYLYKAAWTKTPFVHLCGKRYVDRAEDRTNIKVYSNCDKVTLIMDGAEVETKSGSRIFEFCVPITGEHRIEAVCGETEAACGACRDEMTVRRVGEPNPAYIFGGAGNVVNWFDKEDIKEGFFSIKDTFGALMKNPGTAAIVGRIMAKASASRGEVAQGASDNAVLKQMMQSMPFESLLKKAGANVISPEQIKAINEALQKVPKESQE